MQSQNVVEPMPELPAALWTCRRGLPDWPFTQGIQEPSASIHGPAAPTFARLQQPRPRTILEYSASRIVKSLALAKAKGRPGAMPSDLGTNCRSAPVPFIT
jgi:hypothetical protein